VQAAFDLHHQVCWQAQGLQGLVYGFCCSLCLAPVACKTLMGGKATALYRFGLSFMILSGSAHGVLLPLLG
jgi:hypothetical protein